MVVALDAVTGLPLDDSYLTQYQIPLGSQPINLEELGALGRQSNWLYPDNLPGVVSRLQARDNTNPLNAQDLSTDGKRNLNVNVVGNSGLTPIKGDHFIGDGVDVPNPGGTATTSILTTLTASTILYGYSLQVVMVPDVPDGYSFEFGVYDGDADTFLALEYEYYGPFTSGNNPNPVNFRLTHTFNPPILAASLAQTPNNASLAIRVLHADVSCGICCYVSDT